MGSTSLIVIGCGVALLVVAGFVVAKYRRDQRRGNIYNGAYHVRKDADEPQAERAFEDRSWADARSLPEGTSGSTAQPKRLRRSERDEETAVAYLPPSMDSDFDGLSDSVDPYPFGSPMTSTSDSSFSSTPSTDPTPAQVADPATWSQPGCQAGEPSTGVASDCTPASTPDPTPSYSAPDPAPSYSSSDSGSSYSSSYDSGSSGSSSYDSGSSSSSYDSGSSSW